MKTLSKEPFKDFKYPTLLSQLLEMFTQDLQQQILELEEKELLNFLQSCTAKVGKELFGKMINYRTPTGIDQYKTVLDKLILTGKTGKAQCLVDAGVCLSAYTKKGETILDLAIQENDKEILTSFAEGEFLKDNKFIYIGTKLKKFIKNIDGFPAKLLQQIINLRIADIEGQPTLFQAVVNKGIKDTKLEYLINLGARNALAVDKINSPLSNIFNSLIEMPGRIAKFTTNVEVLKETEDYIECIQFSNYLDNCVCLYFNKNILLGHREGEYNLTSNILYMGIGSPLYEGRHFSTHYAVDFNDSITLSNGKQIKYKPNSKIYFDEGKLYLISTNLQLGISKDFADKAAIKLRLVHNLIENTLRTTYEIAMLKEILLEIIEYTQHSTVNNVDLLKWYLTQDIVKANLSKINIDNTDVHKHSALFITNIALLELVYHLFTPNIYSILVYKAIKRNDVKLLEWMLKQGTDMASLPKQQVTFYSYDSKTKTEASLIDCILMRGNKKALDLFLSYKIFKPSLELFKIILEYKALDNIEVFLRHSHDFLADSKMSKSVKELLIAGYTEIYDNELQSIAKKTKKSLKQKQQIKESKIAKVYPEKMEILADLIDQLLAISTQQILAIQKIIQNTFSSIKHKNDQEAIQELRITYNLVWQTIHDSSRLKEEVKSKTKALLSVLTDEEPAHRFDEVWAHIFEGKTATKKQVKLEEKTKFLPFERLVMCDDKGGTYLTGLFHLDEIYEDQSTEYYTGEELTEIPGDMVFNDLV